MGGLSAAKVLHMLRMKSALLFLGFVVFLAGTSACAEDIPPMPEIKDHLDNATKAGVAKILAEARAKAESMNAADIEAKAQDKAATMQVPINTHAEEGQQSAQKAADQFYAPETQKKQQCEQTRIQQQVLGVKKEEEPKKPGTLSGTEKVYLFLSSSMPEDTVRAYLISVDRAGENGIVPVMYGFVQGINNKAAMAGYFNRIQQEDKDCQDKQGDICKRLQVPIKINSELFRRYNISQVPAVVYANGENSWSVQGDSPLDYLLEQINRDAHSPSLSSLIIRMRGAH